MWKIHQKKKSNITSSYRRLTYIYCFLLNNVKSCSFFFLFLLVFLANRWPKKKKENRYWIRDQSRQICKGWFSITNSVSSETKGTNKKKNTPFITLRSKKGEFRGESQSRGRGEEWPFTKLHTVFYEVSSFRSPTSKKEAENKHVKWSSREERCLGSVFPFSTWASFSRLVRTELCVWKALPHRAASFPVVLLIQSQCFCLVRYVNIIHKKKNA